MMWRKINITNTAKVLGALLIVVAAIGFAERKNVDNTCTDIVIRISNLAENYFVDEADILRLMTADGNEVIIGTSFDDLNLKEIEKRVYQEAFIKDIQIYRDLKGNLLVEAALRRPFARVIAGRTNNYLAMDGTFLPVTGKYNTRVVILSGEYFSEKNETNLTEMKDGSAIYDMLNFIYKNEFWRAQIAEIIIDKDGEITMQPQITKQLVEFGSAKNYRQKFKKLKIFYDEILPRKGWNNYERVNLKYKDQVIAE